MSTHSKNSVLQKSKLSYNLKQSEFADTIEPNHRKGCLQKWLNFDNHTGSSSHIFQNRGSNPISKIKRKTEGKPNPIYLIEL